MPSRSVSWGPPPPPRDGEAVARIPVLEKRDSGSRALARRCVLQRKYNNTGFHVPSDGDVSCGGSPAPPAGEAVARIPVLGKKGFHVPSDGDVSCGGSPAPPAGEPVARIPVLEKRDSGSRALARRCVLQRKYNNNNGSPAPVRDFQVEVLGICCGDSKILDC